MGAQDSHLDFRTASELCAVLLGFKKKYIYILDSPPVKNNCRRAREIFCVCALYIEKFLSMFAHLCKSILLCIALEIILFFGC